jgi:hypothetical protein
MLVSSHNRVNWSSKWTGFIVALAVVTSVYSCHRKVFHVVAISRVNDVKVVTLDNSDCALSCKEKYSFAAINDKPFKITARFEYKYHYTSRDTIIDSSYVLQPGDSLIVGCGCVPNTNISGTDWSLILTIISTRNTLQQ